MRKDELGVPQLVEWLAADIGATAVALVDRRDADLAAWPAGLPASLRRALDGFPCLRVDWARARSELLGEEETNSTCDCGERHQLRAVAMHGRWVLVIVTKGLLLPDGCFEPTTAADYALLVLGIREFLEDGGARRRGPRPI